MNKWTAILKYNPIKILLDNPNPALNYFVKKDLLDETVGSVEELWKLPIPSKILKKQQLDGSWKYPGKIIEEWNTQEDYNQIETFRQLGYLIDKFGFNKKHPAIRKAAEFFFSKQTSEGDIRGIYNNQHSPNYSAMFFELLIKAGYENDPRIKKGLDWLLGIRQDDGGWVIAMRTLDIKWEDAFKQENPLKPDKTKPHAHLITGAVLRAFSIHPDYNQRKEVLNAGKLLATRIFDNDKYSDKKDKSNWTKFTFPFWFNDLISTLTVLYCLKFTREEPKVQQALDWFINEQKANGLWNLKVLRAGGDKDIHYWMTLHVSQIFKHFYQ